MSSTNKTSLGLNMWEASDKPVRQDFVNDNVIIDEKISELNGKLPLKANVNDLANKGVYTGDLNYIPVTINALTIYRSYHAVANAPVAAYGLVETMYIDSSDYAIQRFTSLENPSRLFTRRKNNGVWASWAEINDLKLGYKDIIIESKVYVAGEKYQVSINVPDVPASRIVGAKIIGTTNPSHEAQYSIEIGGASTCYIINNWAGGLTDALTVRFYYWS